MQITTFEIRLTHRNEGNWNVGLLYLFREPGWRRWRCGSESTSSGDPTGSLSGGSGPGGSHQTAFQIHLQSSTVDSSSHLPVKDTRRYRLPWKVLLHEMLQCPSLFYLHCWWGHPACLQWPGCHWPGVSQTAGMPGPTVWRSRSRFRSSSSLLLQPYELGPCLDTPLWLWHLKCKYLSLNIFFYLKDKMRSWTQSSATHWPRQAMSTAVSFPIPVFAPVIRTVFPIRRTLLRQAGPAIHLFTPYSPTGKTTKHFVTLLNCVLSLKSCL